MTKKRPSREQTPFEGDSNAAEPPIYGGWPSLANATKAQKFRWFLARAFALLGTFVLLVGVAVGFSGWYTSRPEFCRSCHIMEPYYVSWQHSSHKDVSCIKCHFPPGVGEKVRGKMLGLVQLAKYVTETAGPRPAAEIPDASCLRSGCHEARLLSGRLEFQGIPFDHAPHLQELRREKKLRCVSCHSQIVQGSHMTVTTTTCFLCHFKDEHFNEGLGSCTRCHQIPDKEFDLGGGVSFDHNLAYERAVDCAKCHGDLVRGNGEVPRERCTVCHNREDDLKRIDDHVFLHQTHVTDHKIDCLSCHLAIQHALDDALLENSAADCNSCHPGHHQEQVAMLQGIGARSVESRPSSMTVARITCRSCHRIREVSETGTVLWNGSTDTCVDCHDAEAADRLNAYQLSLRDSLGEIEVAMEQIREAITTAELPTDESAALTKRLNDLQYDLSFLRISNGVHNIHYADTITRSLIEQLISMAEQLQIEDLGLAAPEPLDPTE
jgi:nitrate/TMAO reductase-like tetraheme cytochrome c subunit